MTAPLSNTPAMPPHRWPLSFFVLMLLLLELGLYAWWGGVWAVVVVPWLLRLLIALTSRGLSLLKGSRLRADARLSLRQWLDYFGREYVNFCLQNMLLLPFVRFFRSREDGGLVPGRDGPVVLLQHGYVNNGGVWFQTTKTLERAGYRVFTIDQPPFEDIEVMAQRLQQRIEAVLITTGAAQLTLVAHSMGGLIARAYLRQTGEAGATRVARLITLGSPHQGTHLARLAMGRCGAQMLPGNEWLQTLAETPVHIPFTSVYSLHDTVIAPQLSSRMQEAENLELTGVGHVSMPDGRFAREVLLPLLKAS